MSNRLIIYYANVVAYGEKIKGGEGNIFQDYSRNLTILGNTYTLGILFLNRDYSENEAVWDMAELKQIWRDSKISSL